MLILPYLWESAMSVDNLFFRKIAQMFAGEHVEARGSLPEQPSAGYL
ncbi:MAG TPA: hypothetical protein VJ809_14475 [Pirellulales bacterium]|jgi:hypothetical protein|nr:hypothetical protein [Pirellulales bacterium]